MSGPNGDPNISMDDGIINDEDEFDEEGNLHSLQSMLLKLLQKLNVGAQ